MSLLRVTFLSGLATFARLASGLVVTKVLAVYVGPAGLAVLGNFTNFVAMVSGICSAGVGTAVTKYVAEYRNDCEAREGILNAAFTLAFGFSLAVSAAVLLLHKSLANHLFGSEAYSGPLIALGFVALPIGIGALLVAALNGEKRFGAFFAVNLLAVVLGMLLTLGLTSARGVEGAAYAVALAPVLLLAAGIPLLRDGSSISARRLFGQLNVEALRKLSRFSLMALVSAIAIPLTFIVVRNFLISEVSVEGAGQWQGIWRISETYLSVVTATLSVYYLPRLSELVEAKALREEIFRGYRLLLPVTAASSLMIYFSREFVVSLLFTTEFRGMLDLFAFQLVGDFLKIASWILGFLTVAKAMTGVYVACEVGFLLSFAVLTVFFVRAFGLVGVTYAYSLNYLLYLIVMLWVFRRLLFAGKHAA